MHSVKKNIALETSHLHKYVNLFTDCVKKAVDQSSISRAPDKKVDFQIKIVIRFVYILI